MSKLIMEALAFDHGRAAGVNVAATNNTVDGYVESALVSLASARRENPGVEVCLYCNEPLSDRHVEVAKRFGIKVKVAAFDDFLFDSRLLWYLAYYKLCALKHAVGEGYEAICLMDSDTWSRGSILELLESQGVFMVELEYQLSNRNRVAMEQTYNELGLSLCRNPIPSCWGGGVHLR